jgi:alkylhydroperoxidase family enzyme
MRALDDVPSTVILAPGQDPGTAHVSPLDRGDVRDPELAALIERAEQLGVPGALFALILARVPGYAKPLLQAMLRSHFEGQVDPRLKEIIRVQLARRAGSRYFARLRSASAQESGLSEAAIEAGCEDYERSGGFTEKQKWALRYADQMYLNPASLDAAFYAEMKKHYSEAEVMELGAFIAFHYGMQVFMRTLEAPPAGPK